jgi:hypothetical protein
MDDDSVSEEGSYQSIEEDPIHSKITDICLGISDDDIGTMRSGVTTNSQLFDGDLSIDRTSQGQQSATQSLTDSPPRPQPEPYEASRREICHIANMQILQDNYEAEKAKTDKLAADLARVYALMEAMEARSTPQAAQHIAPSLPQSHPIPDQATAILTPTLSNTGKFTTLSPTPVRNETRPANNDVLAPNTNIDFESMDNDGEHGRSQQPSPTTAQGTTDSTIPPTNHLAATSEINTPPTAQTQTTAQSLNSKKETKPKPSLTDTLKATDHPSTTTAPETQDFHILPTAQDQTTAQPPYPEEDQKQLFTDTAKAIDQSSTLTPPSTNTPQQTQSPSPNAELIDNTNSPDIEQTGPANNDGLQTPQPPFPTHTTNPRTRSSFNLSKGSETKVTPTTSTTTTANFSPPPSVSAEAISKKKMVFGAKK